MRVLILLLSVIMLLSVNAYAKVNVYVSILPQKYFVNAIGKDRVTMQVMVMPGASLRHTSPPAPPNR